MMVQTNQLMSYFQPPIAPIRDANGRFVRKPTLLPVASLTVEQVYARIVGDENLKQLTLQVRNAADLSLAKRTLLPYVTPFGTFSWRRCDGLTAFSGLLPIDVDKLSSPEEAEQVKHALFDDPYLDARLVFISPGGKGVKAFVPWQSRLKPEVENPAEVAARHAALAMDYVRCLHDPHADEQGRGVDPSGKDVVRACFLCHDPKALIKLRMKNE